MFDLKSFVLVASFLGMSLAGPLDKRQGNGDGCTICIDNANDCGQMYGGCWDFCATARQDFPIPACNGVSDKTTVCEYFKNDCGKVFGTCYPAEGPIPLIADPGCGEEGNVKREETCEWFTNACGKKYGGCYPVNGPIPMFADPGCP
ncbi:hypothetical protein M409DRAFT_30055 [Zasmidium cellare ATCC 36951]|uniref:Kazal-like domain-containing protein n=1 Tax=Zasmidium cellare ATCC 36951 TaxID=1080233 RepID=A0A6A6BXC0_ZASCE|nr:uncharacterized protein M409DRAFT_30055 [Zasmidium cellare ATCC 36951]KAF2159437.1 hypothetical protein M409DRAFT_30055 [Zasmidium cellare ATCC 36951]